MNPLAICALLGLSCAAPQPAPKPVEVLGMVGGRAREVMQADWDAHANNPSTPERLYEVTKDSLAVWQVGPTDTLIVLFVLDVEPVPARFASPVSFSPARIPTRPTIHTHFGYCDPSPWGLLDCSTTRPEAHQCRPSFADERTQAMEGHPYDAVMCDRNAWAFYYPARHT